MNILLTGTRHTVAVDLARDFHRAGNKVFSAETQNKPITSYSSAIEKHFVVPSPRFEEDGFIAALIKICQEQKIDMLYPVLEEIIYVAKHREELLNACPGLTIMADDFDKLIALHDKLSFYETVCELGIQTPHTTEITSKDQLLDILNKNPDKKYVLKPVYSRYAMGTRIVSAQDAGSDSQNPERGKALDALDFRETRWILQDFIEGNLVCLYCFADEGRIIFHIAYHNGYTSKKDDGFEVVNFLEPYDDDSALVAAAEKIIAHYNFTGNISFDFIHAPSQEHPGEFRAAFADTNTNIDSNTNTNTSTNSNINTNSSTNSNINTNTNFILECNPRITGGFHILRENNMFHLMVRGKNDTHLTESIHEKTNDGESDGLRTPRTPLVLKKHPYQFLCFCNALAINKYSFGYIKALLAYQDALFRIGDLKPWLFQLSILQETLAQAQQYGITPDEAAVYDISWMG